MSPSVAQRRRRRQRSVDFHRLWWLLRREAFYQVMRRQGAPVSVTNELALRSWVRELDSREIQREMTKLGRRGERWRLWI